MPLMILTVMFMYLLVVMYMLEILSHVTSILSQDTIGMLLKRRKHDEKTHTVFYCYCRDLISHHNIKTFWLCCNSCSWTCSISHLSNLFKVYSTPKAINSNHRYKW